jgi:hypothetical protein
MQMGLWEFFAPEVKANATDQGDDYYFTVSGPFDPGGLEPVRGDVVIRYELIQHLPGETKVIIDGYGTWNASFGTRWHGYLSKDAVDAQVAAQPGARLNTGNIRGIATAVVVTDPPTPPPGTSSDPEPIFMSITWCSLQQLTMPTTA